MIHLTKTILTDGRTQEFFLDENQCMKKKTKEREKFLKVKKGRNEPKRGFWVKGSGLGMAKLIPSDRNY